MSILTSAQGIRYRSDVKDEDNFHIAFYKGIMYNVRAKGFPHFGKD